MRLPPRLTALRAKDSIDLRRTGKLDEHGPYSRNWEPRLHPVPTLANPISQACTYEQTQSVEYRHWCDRLRIPHLVHRKQWEWVYIVRSLEQAGCLQAGKSGVGFGVGTEPLSAAFVRMGASVLATDAAYEDASEAGWVDTNQHAKGFEALNDCGLATPEAMAERAEFRVVDMREVPDDIKGYDFAWSACALEHLGTLEAGFDFIRKSLECVKPGGVVVHTTEYNLSANEATVETGPTVLYRRTDLERFARSLKEDGHEIRLTFGLGDTVADRYVDEVPYTNCHLKLWQDGFVITSFGLTIGKKP